MILNLNGQRVEGSSYNIVLQNIISYIGADPVIIPGTIRENLLHGSGMRVRDTELTKILHDYSCDFIFNLPNRLDYKITENDTGLSTGQKQRISIVRAMLRQPVVLILDEVTSNLDEATELEILQSIKQNSENLIIIAAGHRKSFRTYSDFNYTFSAQGNIVQD
jgi:ABC-type bacteriocin/lantibiotic exporter with double-glycine peptidase domain